jgi:hypothetical protein
MRSPSICSRLAPIYEPFSSCSEWRHTANEQPTEVRITYRFHPRFGETVFIRRCLERGGIEYFVVHQPDGSFACLPAWMMQPSASRFEICDKPNFSLDILRSLRAQVDDLLGFLLSESKTERADNDAPNKNLQRSLFDEERPRIELRPVQRAELATVVEALLREIAAALVNAKRGESDHEQDHS